METNLNDHGLLWSLIIITASSIWNLISMIIASSGNYYNNYSFINMESNFNDYGLLYWSLL